MSIHQLHPNILPLKAKPEPRLSSHMEAVLMVVRSDQYLEALVMPYINIAKESIDWDGLFDVGLCSGHRAAVTMAYSLWTDEVRPKAKPFIAAHSMDRAMQTAVLKALALRWNLNI